MGSGLKTGVFAVLICLPAALVLGVGGYFVATRVPKAIAAEPRRVTMAYRELAEKLVAGSPVPTYVGKRKKGWRKVGDIAGCPWGYVPKAGAVEVWRQGVTAEGLRVWRACETAPVEEFPYAVVFYGGGGVVAILLLVLSGVAVGSLFRFLKERDDFMAATAHDLITPLVGLRLNIGRNDAEAKILVERMMRLVQNMRDFLRLGGRRPRPVPRAFDLQQAYDEAYALFRADYQDLFDGADVGLEIAAGCACRVFADETMTVQVLWNLLANELKYAAPYGYVRVRISESGGWVRAEFLDGGKGMTPHERRHAFDRYYRAKTVLVSGKGGFGIGLCTARELSRAMGGDLTVAPNEPTGCVFTLTLPRAASSAV